MFDWAHQRKLTKIIGPKGFGVLDGYGFLVEGYEHRQVMTMRNYNFPYYASLAELQGMVKEVDFVSCYAEPSTFQMPERIFSIADRVEKKGVLTVKRFTSKKELKAWAARIADLLPIFCQQLGILSTDR